MKRYVTPNDLKAVSHIKGEILKEKGNVVLVKTANIFTVWNPEEGFHFCNTFYEEEALETFNKYTKE